MSIAWHGAPKQIKMDNGPEFISHRLTTWAEQNQIKLLHIQPSKPAQNAYIECFNRIFREDVLNACLFSAISDAHKIAEQCLEEYNAIRPHHALNGLTPYQFAAQST